MKIEPFKMRVTPEQSRRVQEFIFENGGKWRNGKTTVIRTDFPCLAFDLRGDGDGISGWSDPFAGLPTFSDAEVPEITYDEFINKYGKQMKNLKLEVGKTYLNRKGERVKIVKETGGVLFPFDGDDCLSYTFDGRYWYDWRDSAFDLIAEAEAPPTFRTFKIPENTREISVNETDGRIVIEFVPELKNGDVCINERGTVYIFKEDDGNRFHQVCGGILRGGELVPQVGGCVYAGRLATPAEAQQLFDALAEYGKRWNPDTLKIEELTERDRMRAFLHQRGWVGVSEDSISDIEAYIKHREAQQ